MSLLQSSLLLPQHDSVEHDSVHPQSVAPPQTEVTLDLATISEVETDSPRLRACRREYLWLVQQKQLSARGSRKTDRFNKKICDLALRCRACPAPNLYALQCTFRVASCNISPPTMQGLEGSSLQDPWVLRDDGRLVLQSMSRLNNPNEIRDLELLRRITLLNEIIHAGPPSTPRRQSHPVPAASSARRPTNAASRTTGRVRHASAPPAMAGTKRLPTVAPPGAKENEWSGRKRVRISLKKRYLGCRPPLPVPLPTPHVSPIVTRAPEYGFKLY
ncbi:hypothetical protein C8R47DRAFT_1082277 [Mycena vitilis]|nr:hypothetical protein C8R47DRAFT_1082277 [Mycena vitilis]